MICIPYILPLLPTQFFIWIICSIQYCKGLQQHGACKKVYYQYFYLRNNAGLKTAFNHGGGKALQGVGVNRTRYDSLINNPIPIL